MSQKICLIDGSGYIFRAFYALPPLNAPDGTPVNAVFGFTNMFMRLTSKIKCDYCLVLFDAKRRNFRNDIFPDYKATRKETPEELIPQFPIIHQAVEALNLHFLEMEGFEADDLIATYAKIALSQGLEVVVVSGDKDLMQLIRPGVEFYDPMKDKFFSPEDVKEKFGVYPDKVVDVQALSGDSIDNVPGVPGIGPKTAAQLINEYGSLEEVLTHASEIKQEKRRQLLLEHAQNARISLQLVTLKADAPVPTEIGIYKCKAPSLEIVNEFIEKYGFYSLRSKVERWVSERCSCVEDESVSGVFKGLEKKYEKVVSETDLKKWRERILSVRRFAFDVISNGSDDIEGISLAVKPGEACYIPFIKQEAVENFDLFSLRPIMEGVSPKIVLDFLLPLFASKSVLKIGHNIKASMHLLSKVSGENADFSALDDVAVISYDLYSSEHTHSLEELSKRYLEEEVSKIEDLVGSGKNKITFSSVGQTVATTFMSTRADCILRLWLSLKSRLHLEQKTAVYENFDRRLISVLYAMESRGILVDAKSLQELSGYFKDILNKYEREIYSLAGEEFNIGSPKQIGDILFGKLGFKGKKTPSGAWQTGADVLEDLKEQGVLLAQKILDWREASKLKSTYTDALSSLLDKENRIHTTYSQTVVNTGRLASNNPNLQNIPIRSEDGKKIRACFIAKPGHKLISADYSQVELRLLACVANVKKLKEAFAAGIDIHAATASHVFGVPPEKVDANLRRHAKAINFGIVYGISAYGLAKQINVEPAKAKAYIDAYFAQMPEIKAYMDETIKFAHAHDYVLTPFGRKCAILGINDSNKRLSANAERAAINAPIQGGAADIIKLAMIRVERELKAKGYKTKMLLQVHDELVFESPDEEVEQASKEIKEIMENIVDYEVPFIAEVGIGTNWSEAH